MKIKKQKYRRSDTKIMTKEAKVLKYLRESRQLSMRQAGRILGSSDALVSHSEHGRIDLTGDLIMRFLNAYGYEYSYFQDLVSGKIHISENTLEQCMVLLKRLHPDKLKTVHSILQSF
jgi:transcriptional regulator with XRE-family HTH domain